MDKYQQRYREHQKRKKEQLLKALKERHSDRVFSDKEIEFDSLKSILDSADYAPSSCNRKAVKTVPIKFRDNKELLSGILVGGVGWIHRAPLILLLVADKSAYKEGLDYMPYLDAGFMAQNMWITATMLGVKCCFVNPNVREEYRPILYDHHFLKVDEVLCGALAMGYSE